MLDARTVELAVARMLHPDPAKRSTPKKEAERLKVDIRTMERHREKARKAAAAAAPSAAPSPSDTPAKVSPDPVVPSGDGDKDAAVDAVLKAADGEKKPAATTPAPTPPVTAEEDGKKRDADYAIREYKMAKAVLAGLGGLAAGIDLDDPKLEEAAELSGLAEDALRENPEQTATALRKITGGGPWFLLAVLGLDAAASGVAIWKHRGKLKRQREAEKAAKEKAGKGKK